MLHLTRSVHSRSRLAHRLATFSVACGIALITASAHADSTRAPGSLRESLSGEAAVSYDAAKKHYAAGDFTAARDEYTAAFNQSGDPRVLYNVAVCEKALGRFARAIATLKRSLATAADTGRDLDTAYRERVAETIATLSKYTASVTLESPVAGATFTLDGEAVTENPATVDRGAHFLRATHEGFEPAETTLEVHEGEARTVTLPLVPKAAPHPEIVVDAARPPHAELRVTADNPGDAITLDGAQTGHGFLRADVAPGEHHVVLSRADGANKTLDLFLKEGENRDVRVSLNGADEGKHGISPWWFVGGGTLVVGAGVVVAAVLLSNRSTRFEGSGAGTLNPYVVPASIGAWR